MSDEKNLEGQTFENRAATPSDKSRIVHGEYVENAPDPTEARGLSGRRTSGGRLLPDLPSAEIETSEDSAPDEKPAPLKPAAGKARNS